ncbi:MAG: hypothetical protein AAGN82_23300 [Myxococcota bacterium]
MNIEDARITLRPRTAAEVFDLALLVTTQGMAGVCARLGLLVLAPMAAVGLFLRYGAEATWMTVMLATWLYASWAQGLFTIAAGRWLLSTERPTVRSVLRAARGQGWRWLGTWLRSRLRYTPIILWAIWAAGTEPPFIGARADVEIVGPLIFVGLFAAMLVLPAHHHTLFLNEAATLERASASTAVRRSRDFARALSSRSWSATLMLVAAWAALLGLTEGVMRFAVESVLQTGFVAPSPFEAGGSPYLAIGMLVATPVLAVTRFLFYIDGRTRVDGWDVQVQFMARAAVYERRARALGHEGVA